MRATGIVRRIDELGRVVIPKEIRRTLRIREGEPLETTFIHLNEYSNLINRLVDKLLENRGKNRAMFEV